MKRRTLAAIVSVVLALLFGFLGDGTDVEALSLLSGLFFLTALVLFLSILPFWKRILPPIPAMPELFPKPFGGQLWCDRCGTPSPPGSCLSCGAALGKRKQSAKVK